MSISFPQSGHASHALVLTLVLALLGCQPKPDNESGAMASAGGPTVDQITDEATPFLDQSVTVSGEVGLIGGPQLFTIEDDDPMGDEHLLVLSARPVMEILADSKDPLADDDEVQVTGTVRRLVITEIERELGFDLDSEYEVEFRGRPILVATSVRRTTDAASGSSAASQSPPVTDVLVLVPVPGPQELVGRPVRLDRVSVQAVVSDKGFWVGPHPDQQLFIRLDEAGPDGSSTEHEVTVQRGQRLTIFGMVKRVPPRSEVESQWGLSPTESKHLARNEALYVAADSVRTEKA